MNKQLLIGLGIALASPLVLAQSVGNTDLTPQKSTSQAQSQSSQTPAVPGLPSTGGTNGDNAIQGPTTDSTGTTSGSARTKNAHGGAAVNPNSGHGSAYGSGGNQFGTLDANGDGRLSRDEIRGNAGLSGQFSKLDKNGDGNLSRAEYSAGLRAVPGNAGGSGNSGKGTDGHDSNSAKDQFNRGKNQSQSQMDKGKQNVKDEYKQNKDDLDRSLNGGG